MNCPICDKELYSPFGIESYSCPTRVIVVPILVELSHYSFFRDWKGDWSQIAYISKYKITTHSKHSVLDKYDDNGHINRILDTREINIGPLDMQSEKDMLRRIETILVFS